MPRNILRLAAAGVCAAGALGFVVGLNGAGPRPRLPGEPLEAANGPPAPIFDNQPISPEEIAPPGPTPAEKAAAEAEAAARKLAAAELEEVDKPIEITPPPVDRVGELLDAAAPPAEDEPPH